MADSKGKADRLIFDEVDWPMFGIDTGLKTLPGNFITTTAGTGSLTIDASNSVYEWTLKNFKDMYNKPADQKELSEMDKILLNEDAQALVKVGYLGADNQLTDLGRKAIWAIQFAVHKEALVKLAKEKIAAFEASKK